MQHVIYISGEEMTELWLLLNSEVEEIREVQMWRKIIPPLKHSERLPQHRGESRLQEGQSSHDQQMWSINVIELPWDFNGGVTTSPHQLRRIDKTAQWGGRYVLGILGECLLSSSSGLSRLLWKSGGSREATPSGWIISSSDSAEASAKHRLGRGREGVKGSAYGNM